MGEHDLGLGRFLFGELHSFYFVLFYSQVNIVVCFADVWWSALNETSQRKPFSHDSLMFMTTLN